MLYAISSDTKQEYDASRELRSGKHDNETVTLLYRLANHMEQRWRSKLGPDLNLCLSSGTPQCPGLTNRSNCPSLPTRNSRPTCRNSLPTLFVSIDMFLYRTIYRPRRSKRCRAKRSARHYGTTSGPSPTSVEIRKSRHVNARSLQKSTLEYNYTKAMSSQA